MDDVLFVCVHNAGRSQMAKAWFNAIAQEQGLHFRAESAGTEPAQQVHSNVVEVMHEAGLNLSNERPKLLTNELIEKAGRVITMGCAVDSATCPAVFLKDVEDWGLPDPRDRGVEEVRGIRDTIRRKVEALVASLNVRHG